MCMGRLPTLHPSTAAVFVVNGRAPSSVKICMCVCDEKQARPSSVQTTISRVGRVEEVYCERITARCSVSARSRPVV